MATVRTFEDLDIWQKARAFSQKVYSHFNDGRFAKDFALRNQINASSGSIMDNIAEGFERGGTKEFVMFLSYAKGSAGEARSQLYRAHDRKYLNDSSFEELRDDAIAISKGISGFMAYLKNTAIKGSKFHDSEEQYGSDYPGD